MFVPLDQIYIPPDLDQRIREPENLAAAVKERTESIMFLGQLQPILLEQLPEPIDGKPWKLIDGQVRFVSLIALNVRLDMGDVDVNMAFAKWKIKPGKIEATEKDNLDPITLLMMEFHANEDRTDFTWNEKGRYIRRIHDMLVEHHSGEKEKWTAKKTALAIGQSEATVSQYLKLTDENDPIVNNPRVQNAASRRTALKQLDIEKAKHQRVRQAETDTKRMKELSAEKKLNDFEEAARLVAYKGDAREWIKTIPDNVFDWFHWDPPYGGREGEGGAFAAHKAIHTDLTYCLGLMETMLPQIWRTMREGAWLALWYTPVHYNWVRLTLQGHSFDTRTGKCRYCFKHITEDYLYLTTWDHCGLSPHPFWVNPYPNNWYKQDRVADGHEITRFLTKQTEPFLLAGKILPKATGAFPILQVSSRGNVFVASGIERAERRHVNHKPPQLLKDILSIISVPGSTGGDAGAGSGSIIEAAFEGGRKVLTAEIDEEYWPNGYAIALTHLRRLNYGVTAVAPWLED